MDHCYQSACCPSPWAPDFRRAADCFAKQPSRLAAGMTFLFFFLSLGSRPLQSAEADSQGEIVFGMSTVLTGSTEDLGKDMQRGVLAGFERANRQGGINGRRLRLIALDDGYEPARTGPNMRQLIEKDKVLAIIGNVGTPTAIVSVPLVNEEKTLLFAAFSGAPVLRNDPPDRYVINFRASYAEEITEIVDALIDVGELKPEEIAFFTQRDSYGDAGFALAINAFKRHGLIDPRTILRVGYERNTLAVESAVANLLMSDRPPRAVVMFGAYAPCAKFIKFCRLSELNPLFLSVSFIGSGGLVNSLGKTDAHLIVTRVVPSPQENSGPLLREYQADLAAMNPAVAAGYGDFEGYIAARIVTLALTRIQGPPTREAVVDALEALGRFDLGLGEPLYLSRTVHQACHRIWPTLLKGNRFEPFAWSEIKAFTVSETSP